MNNIRNFCITAHIDHGKSTLADRFLELTGTVPKNKMHAQYLDRMPLEQERGITIKMQPVRMVYHSNRGNDAEGTLKDAENLLGGDLTNRMTYHSNREIGTDETQNDAELLYENLSYKIRGVLFEVRKKLGLGHKELIYHNALEIGFRNAGLAFESKKNIPILYDDKKIGTYQPDFVIENKILIELKTLPEIGRPQLEQTWSYLKGCDYKLALLVNFGSKDLEIKRFVYDTARQQSIQRPSALSPRGSAGGSHQVQEYVLNLIDTPGHTDFSYEVSRSFKAVEGAILLVEAAKGVQAQTVSNYNLARKNGLTIIPVLNKIDLPEANVERVKEQIAHLTGCDPSTILGISAKTGQGVEQVLERVIAEIPAPQAEPTRPLKALIFDSAYDTYKGVIIYIRVFEGSVKAGQTVTMLATNAKAVVKEVGVFTPDLTLAKELTAGGIGYIATGLKDITLARVGDTVAAAATAAETSPLPGYAEIKPRVFASLYPSNEAGFDDFSDALERLRLNDAALSYQLENSAALGRGYRVGFLGTLHLEIVVERLKREFGQDIIVTSPSVAYRVTHILENGRETTEIISSPAYLPEPGRLLGIEEPWVALEVTTPTEHLGNVMGILSEFRTQYGQTSYLTETTAIIQGEIPLADIMEHFHDRLKSATSGYASADYQEIGYREGDLVKLEFIVAHDLVEAFSRIVPRAWAFREGARICKLLKDFIPKQLFTVAIQARLHGGKIIAREDIKAYRKDVTGYLYGGD